jgi:PDZ domain-containing protein
VKLLGGIALLGGVFVALAFVPTGEVAYAPNAPIDLDGAITVAGQPAEPLQGRMYLVGVTERPVNLLQRLLLDVSDPDIDFGPAPEGRTDTGPAPDDVRSMDEAKQVAAGIAFDLAGDPTDWRGTGATVAAVAADGPARAVLRPGDIIVRVNGRDVDTSVEASRIINRLPPGSRVQLALQRAGTATVVTIPTVAPRDPDSTRRSEIGVELSTIGLRVGLPRNVSIDSGPVVGPSAGLAFALYLYDSLTDDDLLRGRSMVVTGSVAPDGTVLPVGRVRQKAIAAQAARRELLLVPAANAAEATAAIATKCADGAGCTRVVPVRTVQDAIDLLALDDAALASAVAQRATAPAATPAA